MIKGSPFKQKVLKWLIETKGVSDPELHKIEKAQREQNLRFDEALLSLKLVNEEEYIALMSEEFDIPFIKLQRIKIMREMSKSIPEKMAKKYQVVPLAKLGDTLHVVIHNPYEHQTLDDLQIALQKKIVPILGFAQEIQSTIEDLYREEVNVGEFMDGVSESGQDAEWVEDKEANVVSLDSAATSSTPIVKLVDLILLESHKKSASDIHIEPFEDYVRIRYRVDGELLQALNVPKKNLNALVARIKILSALDITENRVPQDGRFRIRFGSKEVDYRVSVLPVYWGSKIVMRALDRSNLKLGLDRMGISPKALGDFKKAVQRPYGMIIMTGPTGSGKSTTLYSILSELNTVERNIITVEDPVEYQLDGITQIQARPDIGLTFASGLRAILRQSPDVVMLGEIRDHETADIAIKAALTGQIVLSTLHTNDAAGAISRLEDMKIEPFLVSASLSLVAAQRLVRQICQSCKEKVKIPSEVFERLGLTREELHRYSKMEFHRGKGCALCHDTGYKGRIAIVETLLVDNQVRDLIDNGASSFEIKNLCIKNGMVTLRQDALDKFERGVTTLEEVIRATSDEG